MKYVFEIATGPAVKATVNLTTIIYIAATAICCASTEVGSAGIIVLTVSGYFLTTLLNIAVAPATGPAGVAAPAPRGTCTAQAAAAAEAIPPPPPPTIVTLSMTDSVVPTIPELTIDNVEPKIPHPTLTRIKGEPDYASMSTIREELIQNAIASKSTVLSLTLQRT